MKKTCRGGYQPPATKKRILGLVLALSMLLSCAPITASAETSGTCGYDVTWTLDDEGTLTISGEGAMRYLSDTPWRDNSADIKKVVIGNGVTSIGEYAFNDCDNLTSVTIPDSVTSIGECAFRHCDSLTEITIPDSVTYIGGAAFYATGYYNNIKNWENRALYIGNHLITVGEISGEYTIKSGTKTIAKTAFADCYNLTSVTIPDSVTHIGGAAFWQCYSLTSIKIPDSVTSIGISVFGHCVRLTEIAIPDSVTSIGENAFFNTEYYNNTENWENGVLYIGNHLIEANDDEIDSEYTIKSGTKTIADCAFWQFGSLTSVTIPDSVTNIGDCAFCMCYGLTSVTIGSGVTSIGDGTFEDCYSLTEITIPDSVTSIDLNAFRNCSGLTSITIPDGITNICYDMFIDTEYYNNTENWENGVLYIGNYLIEANDDEIDTEYTIKSGTKTIAPGAFEWCESLTSITIPDSVTCIGEYAFWNCESLTDVYYGGSETDWESISVGSANSYLTNATIHYNSTEPTPTPLPITTAEITRTDAETDTSYTFEVDTAEEYENCYVYAAIYDADGILIAIKRVPLETEGSTSISVDKSENDVLAKVFIWADTLQPVITVEEFPLI